jgi:hypothetical protein
VNKNIKKGDGLIMKTVFILKEINKLSSGEVEFYTDVYESEEKAKVDMKNQIQEHIDNNNAWVVWEDNNEVHLKDENENEYIFEIVGDVVK